MEPIIWDSRFDVGVPLIDEAHQKLFSIVRRIIMLSDHAEKGRFACVEGVKYFQSYTLQHFAEEEAYMRSIQYPAYETHRRNHTFLRETILPELEQELERENYSEKAIKHFVGECAGWLIGHIMIVDHTMAKDFHIHCPEGAAPKEAIQSILSQLTHQIFGLSLTLTSDDFRGKGTGQALCFKVTYEDEKGQQLSIFFTVEHSLACAVAGSMSGLLFVEEDDLLLSIVREILQMIAFQLVHTLYFPHCKVVSTAFLPLQEAQAELGEGAEHSLLFSTDSGRLGFTLKA